MAHNTSSKLKGDNFTFAMFEFCGLTDWLPLVVALSSDRSIPVNGKEIDSITH